MKILYISCHSVLEFEEIKTLKSLGHEVFSLNGSYQNPDNIIEDDKRPSIKGFRSNQHLLDLAIQSSRANIHEDFFKWCDVIIVMHKLDWLNNPTDWLNDVISKCKKYGVTFVWRTIGQSHSHWENIVKNYKDIKILRYSPRERMIPGYAGENGLIRFDVDPDEYKDWNGDDRRVHVFGQSIKERSDFSNYRFIEIITNGFDRVMYGTRNKKGEADSDSFSVEWSDGALNYEDLKRQYRNARVALYTGTIPASYTLTFIEMMMTGTPLVCIGKTLFNIQKFFEGHDLYEIPDIIKNGENGFVSDSIEELKKYINELLNNYDLAKKISTGARNTALELFDKNKCKEQWKDFLFKLEKG